MLRTADGRAHYNYESFNHSLGPFHHRKEVLATFLSHFRDTSDTKSNVSLVTNVLNAFKMKEGNHEHFLCAKWFKCGQATFSTET